MKRFQFLTGFLCGALLFAGFTSVASAASGVMAAISNQPVYVDGQQVFMTAYQIGGNNYVKLRDIGEAVGFNVYWDGTSVQVESDQPYTGVAPENQPGQQVPAAPAELTEEAVRNTILALRDIYPINSAYPAPYVPNNPLDRPYSNCDKCAGWAMLCSDAVFGDLPWRRVDRPSWDEIRAGDLVQYDGHVMVVLSKTDEYISVTESGNNNKVRWGGQYFKWWLEEQSGYALRTRYPN
jgi:hypothetical protein